MATVQNSEVACDKFQVAGIFANGSYCKKQILEWYN